MKVGLILVGFVYSRGGRLAVLGWLLALPLSARLLDPSAIGMMPFLSKQAFDARYPEQPSFDPTVLTPAWYVVYKHYRISYYFGPILSPATASDYRGQFERVLRQAMVQRPGLLDYELAVRYLPEMPASGELATPPVMMEAEEASPNDPPEPWWIRLQRVFF